MKYVLLVGMLAVAGCSTITKDSRHLVCMTPMGPLEVGVVPGIVDIKDLGDSYQITDIEQKKQLIVSKSACVLFRDAK